MKSATSSTLADRLVQARTDRGLSQEDVAKLASITQQSYSDLERGISKRTTRIGSLAHALGVDAYWLETGVGLPVSRVAEDPPGYATNSDADRTLVQMISALANEKKSALLTLLL